MGGLGFLFLAYYLINDGLNEEYPQIWPIGLGLFFGISGLFCFYGIYTQNQIHIPEKNEKPILWLPVKLNSRIYFSIAISLAGLFFLYLAVNTWLERDKEILRAELVTLTDVISNKVEITKGSKGSDYIDIRLKKYPDFHFDISGVALKVTDKSKYVSNVKTGDTIMVDIARDSYEKKLVKSAAPDWSDRMVNYGFIDVYGLRDRKQSYLLCSDYNEAHKEDAPWGIGFFGCIGLYLLGSAIYLILKKEKPQTIKVIQNRKKKKSKSR